MRVSFGLAVWVLLASNRGVGIAAGPGEIWRVEDADEHSLDEERLSISELEADVAYFDARLALLEEGEVDSFHQEAQIKAYRELERVLSGLLERLRGRTPDQLPHALDGIQVEEEAP